MPKYLNTKPGSLESAVLEAVSPAQQAAIAISKKEKGEKPKDAKDENNYIYAAKQAKEKGEKTFTVGGKQYDVEETLKPEKLVGGQKKLDKDNDGDIDGKDFAAMRKTKKEEVELDENKNLIKDYQDMKKDGKKDASILDVLMSMPKYKRMSKDQMAKIIGDAKRKGIFKEEKVECPQCKGEGCDHCDDKGYHEKMDEKMNFSDKEVKMAIGIASDPRYKGGNYTGAVKAIEKMKKGLSSHPQVAAVLKRQNEMKEEVSLAQLAAQHITNMWKESAGGAKKKVDNKEEIDDNGDESDGKTMTGKPMSKIQVNPKEKEK